GKVTLAGAQSATGDTYRICAAGTVNGCALVTASCVNIHGVGGIGATTALKLTTTQYSVTNAGGGAITLTDTFNGNITGAFSDSGAGAVTLTNAGQTCAASTTTLSGTVCSGN